MENSGPPSAAPNPKRVLATYKIMALASGLLFIMMLPLLLEAIGFFNANSVQGLLTFIGMWLGLPLLLTIPAAVILSIMGLLKGPETLKRRLALWWGLGLGGYLIPAWFIGPRINQYLGIPPGLDEVISMIGLGIMVLLACRWVFRPSEAE